MLEKFIATGNLAPNRLGIPIIPRFRSLILMSPKSVNTRLNKKQFDSECMIKANHLRTEIDEITDN